MPDPIRGVNPVDISGATSTGQTRSPPDAAASGQVTAATPADTADLSRAEALLTSISQAAAAIPAVDRARVAELQQAIHSGAYRPNPQIVAEKIMEIESLLSSRANGE